MNFGQPGMLWLIPVILPLLGLFLLWAWRERQRLVARFVQSRLLATLTVGVSHRRLRLRSCLVAAAAALFLFCLARPQYGFEWEEARQHGLDIVVAIDLSRSMLAADVAPNRLARAKLAAHDLAAQAKSDRLALVVFSGSAFLQCPLTLDEAAFLQNVDALQIGLISDGGTAIAEAIRASMKVYEKENDNHKILVLLTDGEDQESGAVEAAEDAARQGMRIFTVGVGTAEGELIRVADENHPGALVYLKDEDGNVVKSRLNEEMLKQIAAKSGGFYMPLRGARPMETLYERGLAPLPKSDNASKMVRLYHEAYHWPLALAVVLLLTEMFMPSRKRSVPKPPSAAPPALSSLGRTALLLLCALAGFSSRASVTSALRDYKQGKFGDALQEYDRLSGQNTNDFRLHFNAGTSAYQAGKYDAASRQLGESILSPDPKLQENSFYNLGNSLFKQGEPVSEQDQKMKLWEQSLKSFESALKLNPQDPDVKNNFAYVKEQIEKLKQQQQNQSNKDKDQKKDDKKDQKDQKDSQKQKDQDKDKSKQKEKGQDKDQQGQKNGDQDKGDKDQAGQQPKPPEDQRQAQPSKPAGKDSKGGPDQEEMAAAGQMTPQEAQRFLDSQKESEHTLIFQPENKQSSPTRSRRQW
jgi:Ca-activated chloride channel family protein